MLMNYAMSHQGQDVHQPRPCQAGSGSPVLGLTHKQKMEGVVLKYSPARSEELYLTTKQKDPAAASRKSSHGLDLNKLTRNIDKFTPQRAK